MRLRLVALATAVTLSFGACGSDSRSSSAGSSTTSTTAPPVENFTQPAAVTIEITGHRSISYKGDTTINVLRADQPQKTGDRLITLGPYQAVQAGEWTINEAFLSLVKFTGDGEYTLKAPPPGEGTPAMRDYVYTVVSQAVPGGPPRDASRFDVLVQPCQAEVKRNGVEGRVECDELADAQGNTISFTMTWKATGEPRDLLKEAMDKASSTTSTSTP